jgi:hypothetical protein
MYRRIALWLLVTALVASPPVVAAGSDPGPVETVQGTVVSVEAQAKALTVRSESPEGSPEEVRFEVNDETKIVRDGVSIKLQELRQGNVVVVNYRTQANSRVALSIGVQETGRG